MDIVELEKDSEFVYITQSAYARWKGVSRQVIHYKIKYKKILLHESGRIRILRKEISNKNNFFSWSPHFEMSDYKNKGFSGSGFSKMVEELNQLPEAIIDGSSEKDFETKRNPFPKSKGKKI